ncbi:GDSL family lipase [Rathayibacter rathayi]|nr:SGNH/GDSL hydrolase family protein [Rathayibacter rathayi]MWV74786.1 SGNH/GDSL hydrolase family protein [Rathayibacter rathayi NCPPB 2980 = VKM Ac-1601]PPF15600.1 GDSL family lipase [Rathayibacter rathayi]PPF80340.1 GDSL family lipase [Rathayibacter rathayi]PPG12473.1 GDSL family lipase [Rathayibacter rathayi]PPG43761.1 GDSL family lipase [Rathayibacter rathayi]
MTLTTPSGARTALRSLAIGTVLAATAALVPAGAAIAAPAPQVSLLALGDSTTRAFTACGSFTDCPERSWSTGSFPAVDSFAQRLQASRPWVTVSTANFAQSGNTVAQVPARVAAAVSAGVHPNVVTLLVGGNDLCGPNVPVASDGYPMTPVDTFRQGVDAAMSAIRSSWPTAGIVLASVPDNASQWRSVRGTSGAGLWASAGLCRTTRGVSATGTPLSPAAAAASVAAAAKRLKDFDAVLENACDAQGSQCRWDGGALSRLDFTPDLLSTVDHFHPSVAGQARIAEVEWNASSLATG